LIALQGGFIIAVVFLGTATATTTATATASVAGVVVMRGG